MEFVTTRSYESREDKARYVADKYRAILAGRVLDVGADRCFLKDLLPGVDYTGIGMGGAPDIEVDLEAAQIPFADNAYDCVLCLDVLEHLDSIHAVFDELARVTRRYVIISLPNPYRDFVGMLFGRAAPEVSLKYYGLPHDRQLDRHKWFFSNSQAEAFIRARAARCGLNVVQIDSEGAGKPRTLASAVKRAGLRLAALAFPVRAEDLYYKTLWAVLEKPAAASSPSVAA
jgi:SAM-dependent methyltransferase